MKMLTRRVPALTAFSVATLFAFQAARSSAQIFAQDDAGAYTTWTNSMNLGSGFGPWILDQTGTFPPTSYTGFFIGNPDGIGTGANNANAWGIYANGSSLTNAAVAYRGFTNALQVNTVFKIRWRSYGISTSNPDAQGGVCLRNGNATNSTADYSTGYRFKLYYAGAASDSFLIQDGSGVTAVGIPFGSNPLQVEFTLLSANTYRLVIKDGAGVNTLAIFDNMVLAGSGTIDSVALFALQTDGDQVFNSMQITSTSLVPPDVLNVQPADGSIYVSATTPLSFDVSSAFSTVAASGISLELNGLDQINLTITGGGSAYVHVVLNTALLDNLVYSGTIVAADANGNHATNRFTFNTWRSDNPFIEAEDYNFSSGVWIDNFLAPQPNQAYYGLLGSNGIDYLEYDLGGTNNFYRPGDLPQVENCYDVDHANFAANFFPDFDLAYNQYGEWEDYTHRLGNTNYAVYARMAGFGANPVMLMERMASPTVNSTNQPRAAQGTFVCPSDTGGVQSYTFVPLTDFFSNPVMINYAGTNTFRLTCIGSGGSYNVTYLTLIPSTNTATLRPYLASGFPYPGASGVGPDQSISFTIANRQTSVVPGSIQLSVNGSDATGGLVLSSNTAGTVVSYQSPAYLPPGTNTVQVIYSDGSVSQTNEWQFTVATLPVLPSGYALALSPNFAPGFAVQMAKAAEDSPAGDFPPTIARALSQLAGTLTNSMTLLPYANLAAGPNSDGSYVETGTINYDITGTPQGSYTFPTKSPFPYVPASGTNNFIAMAANMYLQLSPGIYTFAVRSDDGFQLTAGPTPTTTNILLGVFDAGRGNDFPTTFDFIVQTNGIYPMRLVYDQGEFGGSIEFYSINRTNGTPVLINDPTDPAAIKAYYLASPLPIPLYWVKTLNGLT